MSGRSDHPGTRFRVYVTDYVNDDLAPECAVLDGIADVEALGATAEDELAERIADADALMVYHQVTIGPSTLDRLERCRIIARCGVGYDNIDLAGARERNIDVANVPDYSTEEVADSTIGLVLSLMRGISQLNSQLRSTDGAWNYKGAEPLHRVRGSVLGLVGMGEIGMAVALRAKALGMDVCFFDPFVPSGRERALGVRRVESFDELLDQSRVLSLHCRLTPETKHMVDEAALNKMRPGSYLVNTARGALVDTSALPEAIASGQLAGAGIDVLEIEPPSPDDPLLAAWRDPSHPAHHRLILNPHTAFYSEEAIHDLRTKGAEACRRALLGQPVRTIVNR